MMRLVFAVGLVCGLLMSVAQGAGWPGDDDSPDGGWLWDDEPAAAPDGAPSAPSVWELASAAGLHEVTEVRSADRVITEGPRTTYITETEPDTPGTFARNVGSVGTGDASAYDALSANRRMTMSDGRPVAGDYYETYVYDGNTFVLTSIDFFADDAEIARLAAQRASVAPAEIVAAPPFVVTLGPEGGATFSPGPRDGAFDPLGGRDADLAPGAGPVPVSFGPGPFLVPAGSRPPRDVRAYVALGPQADRLGRIEVLRGRRAALWLRATVDGAPARVLSWRLASGEVTALGPLGGTGEEPLVAMWPAVARGGSAFEVRFDVVVDVPGEPPRAVDAAIDVVVRSPALVE